MGHGQETPKRRSNAASVSGSIQQVASKTIGLTANLRVSDACRRGTNYEDSLSSEVLARILHELNLTD